MTVRSRASLPLRVLQISSGDSWGGAERMLQVLLGALRAEPRIHVEILLLADEHLAEVLREEGYRVHVIAEKGRSFFSLALEARRWINSRSFDVVHAHRYKELMIAAMAFTPRRRGRLVATVHGLSPLRQLKLRRAVLLWGAALLARTRGASFVAVSEELRRRLERVLGRDRTHCIPNPMPLRRDATVHDIRQEQGWANDQPIVGFVGRLEWVKGPDLFLDLARELPQVNFVFIGSGSMEFSLRREVDLARIDSRVAFLGMVPEAFPFLAGLDVLALTSRHEGTPMVLLEAATCRLPVVSFDVGGVMDVMQGAPASWVAPPGDLVAARDALNGVLGDIAAARREAAVWAGVVERRFSASGAACEYLRVYGLEGPARPEASGRSSQSPSSGSQTRSVPID